MKKLFLVLSIFISLHYLANAQENNNHPEKGKDGGMVLSMDASNDNSIDNQTGIGANLGLGFQYDFETGISLFITPYLKANTLVPFSPEEHQQRLMENGLRLGIMYEFSGHNRLNK